MDRAENIAPHCYSSVFPWEYVCLRSSSSCIFAYRAVVAQQQLYMLHCFLTNSLQAYHQFFFSCASDACGRSRFRSPWLISHSDYSPTIPAAPSSRLLILSGSLIKCQSVQMYYHHPFFLLSAGERSERD
jgi:hypothetical protein